MPKWYSDAFKLPPAERAKLRSKTFEGIAEAIVNQWSPLLLGENNEYNSKRT
jgi:hypothetical protein